MGRIAEQEAESAAAAGVEAAAPAAPAAESAVQAFVAGLVARFVVEPAVELVETDLLATLPRRQAGLLQGRIWWEIQKHDRWFHPKLLLLQYTQQLLFLGHHWSEEKAAVAGAVAYPLLKMEILLGA